MSSRKVIERIRKLLRLAQNSTYEGEAANALSQAQGLMKKHGLDSDSPELSDVIESFAGSYNKAQRLPVYLAKLIRLVAEVFGCEPVRGLNDKNELGVLFIGHECRSEIAAYAYEVLERQLVKARKSYLKTQSKRLKRETKIARGDLFCGAWVMAVDEKVQGLVISDEEANQVQRYKANKYPSAAPAKVRGVAANKIRGGDAAAIAGYEAGKQAELNHGVKGSDTAKLTCQ